MANKIEVGQIYKCSWNGMADYYDVIKRTDKTVTLRKLKWEICSAPEGKSDDDPTYRWTHLVRDENGNPIQDDYDFKKLFQKRIIIQEDGSEIFKSPNYSGEAYVSILKSDYMRMYWG